MLCTMDIERQSSYLFDNEDKQVFQDVRKILKEAEELHKVLNYDYSVSGRDQRTREIYEVLSVVGKDSSKVEDIRIKQLVRERIRALEPKVKQHVEEASVRNSVRQPVKDPVNSVRQPVKDPQVIKKGLKLVPTPLPRVAFLSHRQGRNERLEAHSKTDKVSPGTLGRTLGPAKTLPRRLLSQLLEETPVDRGPVPPYSQLGISPLVEYFHVSEPKREKILPAIPVVPSCKATLSRRNVRESRVILPKTRLKREDRIAVVDVKSRSRKDRLEVQVLPSVNIDSQILRVRRKSNTKLLDFSFKEQQGDARLKPSLEEQEDHKNGTKQFPSEASSSQDVVGRALQDTKADDVVNSLPDGARIEPEANKLFNRSVQTDKVNGNSLQSALNDKTLKHFILEVVKEGMANRLKTDGVHKLDAATETECAQTAPPETVLRDVISTVTQTDFTVQCVDEETSVSETEPARELKDASVYATVDTASVQVQLDPILKSSVALSPVQELLPEFLLRKESKEVEVKPEMVSTATSPAAFEQPAGSQLESSDAQPPTSKPQGKKPFVSRPPLLESSSSSYLTDTTSNTATTTTTSTGDEQLSEGELRLKRSRQQVAFLQSLSEGEITPEPFSTRKINLDSSGTMSEGQLQDFKVIGQIASASSDREEEQQTALESTGELSLRPLSTDPSATSDGDTPQVTLESTGELVLPPLSTELSATSDAESPDAVPGLRQPFST